MTRFNVKRDNFRAIFHKNLFVALNYIIVNLDISRKKSRNFGPKKKNFKSRERGGSKVLLFHTAANGGFWRQCGKVIISQFYLSDILRKSKVKWPRISSHIHFIKFSKFESFSIWNFRSNELLVNSLRWFWNFAKKWYFNGKFKIKVVFAPIEKIDFSRIFFTGFFLIDWIADCYQIGGKFISI